jgi:hypothetical protein
MSGGPIFPYSAYPADTAGRLFPNFYAGAGGNAAAHEEGLGVMASLSADATWELRFALPPSLPTGTLKLRVLSLANATAGALKFTVSDNNVAAGANPSAASLSVEAQSTVTWATGDNDKYKETKLTLTAAPIGNDTIVMALKFQATGTTLAQISTHIVSLIWE